MSGDAETLEVPGVLVTSSGFSVGFCINEEVICYQLELSCQRFNWRIQRYLSCSGFSVDFCINEEKVICYQLELGKYLADVSTECSSRHQGRSEGGGSNLHRPLTSNNMYPQ